MTIHAKNLGVWELVKPWTKKTGTWVIPNIVWAKDDGIWKVAFQKLSSVNITGLLFTICFTPPSLCVACTNLTANPIGGISPYSYAWEVTSTTGIVNFSVGPVGANQAVLSVCGNLGTTSLKCTVTDFLGDMRESGIITVTHEVEPGF